MHRSIRLICLSIPEPTDLASAQASPNWDVPRGYKAAVETEMGRWKTMKVYQPVMSIPDRAKSLGLRLVFTVKTNETGCFDKAKCRLVVLGHRAELGEHYLENCATTMKWPSFRTTMAVALHQGAILFKQWDTSTAFLYADLEPNTECYVKVPPELVEFLGETMPFWKIVKAAYGLPSAPREFQRHVGRIRILSVNVNSSLPRSILMCLRGTVAPSLSSCALGSMILLSSPTLRLYIRR